MDTASYKTSASFGKTICTEKVISLDCGNKSAESRYILWTWQLSSGAKNSPLTKHQTPHLVEPYHKVSNLQICKTLPGLMAIIKIKITMTLSGFETTV